MEICLVFPRIDESQHERLRKALWFDTFPPQEIMDVKLCFEHGTHTAFTYDDRFGDSPPRADVAVVFGDTPRAPRMYQLACQYRDAGTKVILAGDHARALPEEAEQYADSLILGWLPTLWPKAFEDLLSDRLLPRRYYADMAFHRDTVAQTPGLFHSASYRNGFGSFYPIATTSCLNGLEKHLRPWEEVVSDMENHSDSVVYLRGDNFLSDANYAEPFLKSIAERGIQWAGKAGVELLDNKDLVPQIARSGCRLLLIDVLSLNPMVLEQKGIHTDWGLQVPKIINTLQRQGVEVLPLLTIGFDEDQPDVFQKAADFVRSTESGRLALSLPTPIPGTPWYQHLLQEERLLHHSWEKHEGTHVVFKPQHFSPMELQSSFIALCRYTIRYSFRRMVIRENA
jgi:hypothetical protein